MKKIIFGLFFIFFLIPFLVKAQTTLAFINPGISEDTTTVESYLENLKNALVKYGAPADLVITFIANEKKALSLINENKINYALLSVDFYTYHSGLIKKELLNLKLLGSDKKNQNYYLLSNQIQNQLLVQEVYASKKIKLNFVDEILFPEIKVQEIESEANFFSLLKEIATSDDPKYLLLDDFEYLSLTKLKFGWIKNLQLIQKSKNLPHNKIVRFSNNSSLDEKIIKAFKSLNKDKSLKDFLTTLHIDEFIDL